MSLHTNYFTSKNYAYGLDYTDKSIQTYSVDSIQEKLNAVNDSLDSKANIIEILENWKLKTGEKKPKLVILQTSGGGSRSALWTFTVLQNCDKSLDSDLSQHLNLITGASGGMIGAAYFREISLRHVNGEIMNRFDTKYTTNLGKDLLNKLAFSLSTKDLFFRFQTFNYNNKTYPKDRGYAFEEHLHANTEYLMQHNLGYYENPEKEAFIPIMILSPTIVNDGRRLLISSQSLKFLTEPKNTTVVSNSYENIDYQTFFSDNHPEQIRFSTVLRASATFPFLMPMITMPTSPEMQLMDAGIRDNYGSKTALDYIFSLQDWIKKNTSGVIILEIRDTKRILKDEQYDHISFTDKITLPFGNMYNNYPRTQDFDQEQLFKVGLAGLDFPVNIVTFNLRETMKDRISLSWHLTTQEKKKIKKAFYSENNQEAYFHLKKLLQND